MQRKTLVEIPELSKNFWPMEPQKGPPLPKSMKIYWPWYKPLVPPEEAPSPPKEVPTPPVGYYPLYIYTVGNGTVTPSSRNYLAGSVVTLTARPGAEAAFDHWAGDAAGTSTMVNVTMNRPKSVTAYFKAVVPTPPYEEAPPPEEIPEVKPPKPPTLYELAQTCIEDETGFPVTITPGTTVNIGKGITLWQYWQNKTGEPMPTWSIALSVTYPDGTVHNLREVRKDISADEKWAYAVFSSFSVTQLGSYTIRAKLLVNREVVDERSLEIKGIEK